ncbi:hypothetical protein ACGFZP_06930 [Kitasatospora sp. NPDC048239]|uniref:hypothetical protein n=1 Tax=Kitasatospora sp. NPDC048239 TaxID=3364046 RepID=UPI0037206B82
MLTILQLLILTAPLFCWCLLVRTRAVGVTVGAALLALATVTTAVHMSWISTRAEAEVLVGYGPAAALLVVAGSLAERWWRGPQTDPQRRQRSVRVMVGLGAYLVGVVGPATLVYLGFVLGTEFYPSADALPVPAQLTVTRSTADGTCATDACIRYMTVRGPDGMAAGEVAVRLRAALAEDGWRTAADGSLWRRNGWLVDTRPLHAYLEEAPDGVRIELAGLAFEPEPPPR